MDKSVFEGLRLLCLLVIPMADCLLVSNSILANLVVFLLKQVEVDEDPAEAKKDGTDDNVEVSGYLIIILSSCYTKFEI